ncbi:MAG: prepilin peptidase [Alphaproteobacteria bacterium]|nr:prepilin peptidase [Alphaproteobacteria bacterium]
MSFDSALLLFIGVVFYGLLAAAALYDILRFRIPNAIVVALPILFVVGAVIAPVEIDWFSHFGAGLIVLVCAAALFHFNILGGGDAKLLAALSVWAGMDGLLVFLVGVSVLGGVLALGLLMVRPLCARADRISWPRSMLPGHPLPYGVAIGGGAVVMQALVPAF